MHLSPAMSSVTSSAQKMKSRRVSCLSMELIDSAYGYQREIIQLRQEQEMAVAKKNSMDKQNEILRQQKLKNTERIRLLEIEKEHIKTRLDAKKTQICELKEISSDLVHNPMRGRPIPNGVLLKCNQLIDSEDHAA